MVTVGISGPATVNSGQQFTLQAQVQPSGLATIVPTGTVQFFDGATALGNAVTLRAGQASAQVTLSSGGAHSITAKYSGDTTYNAATSPPFTVSVNAAFNFTTPSTTQVIAAGGTATYNVTLSARPGFTGSVSFSCAGATGGATCTVSPNPATLSASTTSVALTVTVANTANARRARPFRTWPFVFAGILGVCFYSVSRNPRRVLLLVLGSLLILGIGSCGSGDRNNNVVVKQNTIDVLVVTGTSGSATNILTLTLTITH
jgi:hypothetical protein